LMKSLVEGALTNPKTAFLRIMIPTKIRMLRGVIFYE